MFKKTFSLKKKMCYDEPEFLPTREILWINPNCLSEYCTHEVYYVGYNNVWKSDVIPGKEIYIHLRKQRKFIPFHFWFFIFSCPCSCPCY